MSCVCQSLPVAVEELHHALTYSFKRYGYVFALDMK
jgi:hypothetical protein